MSGKRLHAWLWLIGCLFAVAGASSAEAKHDKVNNCAEVVLIDVHGSGAAAYQASSAGTALADQLQSLLKSQEVRLETVPFKASGGALTLTAAALKLPAAYHQSVVRTKKWLRKRLVELAVCRNTKVFLAGYSQGAQAAGDVYQERSWKHVIGVALFGDPYYNHKDKSNRFGLNVKPKQRVKTRLDGALAAPRPRPVFNSDKVLSFCHQFDPICQAPLSPWEIARFRTSQHNNYTKFGEPKIAAVQFLKLMKKKAIQPSAPAKWPTSGLKGPPRFMIYLGASFIFPEWSRCTNRFCFIGLGDKVHVYSLTDGIKELGWVPVSTPPKEVFEYLKLSPQEIEELVRQWE